MELVRDGKVVPATFDNVASIGDSVGVRQKSGGANALGQVKFIFPNPYGVYLHDTPTRSTFRRSTRAESHGCVRLENAPALASWLLRDEPAWTPDKMKKAMKNPERMAEMAANARKTGKPDAARLLAGMVEAIAAGKTIEEFKGERP